MSAKYSRKHKILSEYLKCSPSKITKESSYEFIFDDSDVYYVYNKEEVNDLLEGLLRMIYSAKEEAIEELEDNSFIVVDKSAIRSDITSNFEKYIGTGTYEEFNEHFIFLIQ